MWQAIKSLISDHQRFLLTTHAPPDGDGIGSAVALAELLIAMGKEAHIFFDAPMPPRFAPLDQRGLHTTVWVDCDAIIALDTHKLERLGCVAELARGLPMAFIDHHPGKGGDLSVIDAEACSVGAMIYTLFKECGYPLNLAAAEGIYTSVITDTGRFSYSSTSRKAHKLADECIKIGVDPDAMHVRLFQQIPYPYLAVLGAALQRSERHGRVMLQTVLRSDYASEGVDPDDLDYLHEINKSVAGIDCVVLLREERNGGVRLSFRTTAAVDAAGMAAHFGGDGHDRAAGATFKGSVEQAKEQLLALLRKKTIMSD